MWNSNSIRSLSSTLNLIRQTVPRWEKSRSAHNGEKTWGRLTGGSVIADMKVCAPIDTSRNWTSPSLWDPVHSETNDTFRFVSGMRKILQCRRSLVGRSWRRCPSIHRTSQNRIHELLLGQRYEATQAGHRRKQRYAPCFIVVIIHCAVHSTDEVKRMITWFATAMK